MAVNDPMVGYRRASVNACQSARLHTTSDYMTDHPTDFVGSVEDAIRTAVIATLPDAVVEIAGGGGHWQISVVSTGFAGKSPLERQRLVLRAIRHLIDGPSPPVHAVDQLVTRTP
jgi:acid stress-induced BolA-like protein IbaG/YrbA